MEDNSIECTDVRCTNGTAASGSHDPDDEQSLMNLHEIIITPLTRNHHLGDDRISPIA